MGAWEAYGDRPDLAGISLQRQTLVPKKPMKHEEIVNDHKPFLYKLVGSIGFSPHPDRWAEFLEWVETKELETFDAKVEGLVTSDWYQRVDKKSMWTQLFIRFCEERGLYTLYVNLPEGKTLAAHWREKGEHHNGREGRDFALATDVKNEFPETLRKYGWDGREEKQRLQTANETTPGKLLSSDTTGPGMWGAASHIIGTARGVWDGWMEDWEKKEHAPQQACANVTSGNDQKRTKPVIAVCACTRSLPSWKSLKETTLQTLLIPSIKRTVTAQELEDWDVRLHLGIDHDDEFWLEHHDSLEHPAWLKINSGFYKVSGDRVPFNEMMRQAYDDGGEYFVRINDDTEFVTGGWITVGVKALRSFDPPNVGVVGPTCKMGSKLAMTHDFVHRTHMEIFEKNYYPMAFSAWYIDDWITEVYKPGRSVQLENWEVKHHVEKYGTRYNRQMKEGRVLDEEVAKGKAHFDAWLYGPKVSDTKHLSGIRRTGSEYGGWTYNATGITKDSIVYSVGIGEDTSWDEAMMRDHGLQIWGYDPTPKAAEYVKGNQALGSNFHFKAEGLAVKSGTIDFTKPKNPDFVSMRQGALPGLGEIVEVPVNTLEGWMEANGHTHLDILKIDIEGSEYDVLEDWIQRGWFPMDQLLVEFHHRFLDDKARHARVLDGLKGNGFAIIHDANGQEISFQRRVVPRNMGVMDMATRIHDNHGVVVLQLLNEGFVEMTKSWICNVRPFGVLSKTLFVTTDNAAYGALTAFDSTLNVTLESYDAPAVMEYGQIQYYNYMLFRTGLIAKLLSADITLWLTESDAVWLRDPTDLVLNTTGDLVTMSDDQPPRQLLQGGFLLLRPTETTKRLWMRMLSSFASKMEAVGKDGEENIQDRGSEQLMLNKMIREDAELNVGWLDPHLFVPGRWYIKADYRNVAPEPAVILNNWIMGNLAKIKRAKEWSHWYLSNGKCAKATVDGWCPRCKWQGRRSCQSRMVYMVSKYKWEPLGAQLDIVKDSPQCKEQEKRSRGHEGRWCGTCMWRNKISCSSRLDYVVSRYKQDRLNALLEILKNDPQCEEQQAKNATM